ncbi:MAG: VWA domain-containing protein [Desulfobacteraceae bacterium]|nr:MAG: VWA domain-containing protein [Desulfobacteraceae bacterium]
MSIEFLYAQAFWALLSLPFVLGVIMWGLHRREAILKEFGSVHLLAQFSRFSLNRKISYRAISTAFCFALLITVIARPLLYGSSGQISKGVLDVVAVLDVSKSMGAEDCGPQTSRVQMAKDILFKCLPELAGNRIGIVTFAGKSFPQAELTDDFQALKFVLNNWVTLDSAPAYGSNIGKALSEAEGIFEKNDKKKIIILFSDGGHSRQENIERILTDVSARNISIMSVGLGTVKGSRIPVYQEGKFKEWFKINGEDIVTALNEKILKKISQLTGGKYFRGDSRNQLQGIFRDPEVLGKKSFSGGREIFQIPLALSIVLLFFGMCFERRSV